MSVMYTIYVFRDDVYSTVPSCLVSVIRMRWASQLIHRRHGEKLGERLPDSILLPKEKTEKDEAEETENVEEAYKQLKYDIQNSNRQLNYFTTATNPSVAIRHSTRIASLITWTIWGIILFIAWYKLTSVQKSPIPREGAQKLLQSILRIKEKSVRETVTFSTPRHVNLINDITRILPRPHNPSIILAPLCNGQQVKSFMFEFDSALKQKLGVFSPEFTIVKTSIETIFKDVNLRTIKAFCEGSISSSTDILRLLNGIWANLVELNEQFESLSLILYHQSSSSRGIFLSDHPIALVQSPLISNIIDGVTLIYSIWFDKNRKIVEQGTALYPRYLWKFMLVGDGTSKIKWNFEFDQTLMEPFLNQLKRLTDIDTTSRVIPHGDLHSLSSSPLPVHEERIKPLTLSVTELSGFQSLAYKWMDGPVLDEPTNFPPMILHYALYLQTHKNATVRFKTSTETIKQSMAIPKWGALVVPDYEESLRTIHQPSIKQMHSAVSMWLSHWRELLELPAADFSYYLTTLPTLLNTTCLSRSYRIGNIVQQSHWSFSSRAAIISTCFPDHHSLLVDDDEARNIILDELKNESNKYGLSLFEVHFEIPSRTGITEWELNKIGRHSLWSFLFEGSVALVSLVEVLNEQPDLVVEAHLSNNMIKSLEYLNEALDYVVGTKPIDLWTALSRARQGLQVAKECLHDSTTTGNTFFSLEFKAALYLPLALPFVLPIVIAWGREVADYKKRYRRNRT